MITVIRKESEGTQKVVAAFMKRAKKYNLVQRSRKVKYFSKPLSHLKKKTKAMSTAAFLSKKAN